MFTDRIAPRWPGPPGASSAAEGYYATLLHELIHWTGKRLGRRMDAQYGDPSYAEEEVIASIGSLRLCYCLGMDTSTLGHRQYINSWTRGMTKERIERCVDEGIKAAAYLARRGQLAWRT